MTMKKFLLLMMTVLLTINMQAQDIMITGVFDGPLPGGKPKVLELYVINNITDLSVYTIKNQTNANTEWGSDCNLTGSANAGDFIYITGDNHTSDFNTYFANNLTPIESSVVNINGDDRLAIFNASDVMVDLFGEDGVDGTGSEWEYLDGWAYRNNNSTPNATFNIADWTFSGINANDGQTTNATAPNPFPIRSYTQGGSTTLYDLYIASTQVTSENANDLSVLPGVDGTVTYSYSTKTLTLDNATIQTGAAIENIGINNLKIKLIGSNTITASVFCLKNHVSTQIEGPGSLIAVSSNSVSIYMYRAPLTISNCTIEAEGASWGIAGNDGTSGEDLVINKALVKAKGSSVASIADIQSLTLTKCEITTPVGAAFDENVHGVVLNGSLVTEQVVISPTDGIEDIDYMRNISVYPNPANDVVQISIKDANINGLTAQVYDISGKLIQAQTIRNTITQINISKLEKGIYILKIGNTTQRLVKE